MFLKREFLRKSPPLGDFECVVDFDEAAHACLKVGVLIRVWFVCCAGGGGSRGLRYLLSSVDLIDFIRETPTAALFVVGAVFVLGYFDDKLLFQKIFQEDEGEFFISGNFFTNVDSENRFWSISEEMVKYLFGNFIFFLLGKARHIYLNRITYLKAWVGRNGQCG